MCTFKNAGSVLKYICEIFFNIRMKNIQILADILACTDIGPSLKKRLDKWVHLSFQFTCNKTIVLTI